MLISGYEAYQELSRNAWFCLWRGRCQADGSPVLLKTPCSASTSMQAERLLSHEHDILQGLALSGVIRGPGAPAPRPRVVPGPRRSG